MSIAGIAKEVTTISISAWFFGDQLSPLNITGVAITVCGMSSHYISNFSLFHVASSLPIMLLVAPVFIVSPSRCNGEEHYANSPLARHCALHLPQVSQVD
jgi:hypothetical protein